MRYLIISGLVIYTVFFYLAFHCDAQQFSIEMISPITESMHEEAIDLTNTGLLLGSAEMGKKCPFLYNIKERKVKLLCKAGLREAYDINDRGVVVGSAREGGKEVAAIWSKKTGLKKIGKLSSNDTFSLALGINNRGDVVGYSGHIVIKKDQDNYDYMVYVLNAFIYDSKKGLRSLFPGHTKNTVAFKINNRGKILAGISTEKSDKYSDLEVATSTKQGRYKLLTDVGEGSFASYSVKDYINSMSIADNGSVGSLYWLYDGKTKARTYLPQHLTSGRSDYGYATHINNKGDAVGKIGSSGWLYTKEQGDVEIDCLIPQNKILSNNIDISHFYFSNVAAITDTREIAFHGDLYSDGKGDQIYIIRELPSSERGKIYNHCPKFNVSVVGECSSYFSYATNAIYGDKGAIPEGKNCTIKGYFSDNNGNTTPYSGLRYQLVSHDESGPEGYSCDPVVKENVLLGLGGAPAQASFTYSSYLYYQVVGPINDKRFREDYTNIYPGTYYDNEKFNDFVCHNSL